MNSVFRIGMIRENGYEVVRFDAILPTSGLTCMHPHQHEYVLELRFPCAREVDLHKYVRIHLEISRLTVHIRITHV